MRETAPALVGARSAGGEPVDDGGQLRGSPERMMLRRLIFVLASRAASFASRLGPQTWEARPRVLASMKRDFMRRRPLTRIVAWAVLDVAAFVAATSPAGSV